MAITRDVTTNFRRGDITEAARECFRANVTGNTCWSGFVSSSRVCEEVEVEDDKADKEDGTWDSGSSWGELLASLFIVLAPLCVGSKCAVEDWEAGGAGVMGRSGAMGGGLGGGD